VRTPRDARVEQAISAAKGDAAAGELEKLDALAGELGVRYVVVTESGR
jgi:hypothetical protein